MSFSKEVKQEKSELLRLIKSKAPEYRISAQRKKIADKIRAGDSARYITRVGKKTVADKAQESSRKSRWWR